MLRLAAGQRRTLAFLLLAFFLIYWIPFSGALPEWVPLQFGSFRVYQASKIAMWAIVALGLNLLTGYNGQISLGHGAFVAVGGYTSAILMVDYGWPFWATIPVAGVLTGAVGFGVGVPALRLTGPYLAVATLALALAMPQIIAKYDNLTHGAEGISIPPLTTPGALDGIMNDTQYVYFVAILVAAIMTFIAWNIVRSRLGRAFIAIRDSEIAAQAMGISVPRFKTMAFAISAFYAGVCGGLYIQVVNFVSPQSFEVIQSINYLTTIVVGGLASILGSILGAAVFVLVPEINPYINNLLETFHLPTAETASDVLFGTSLILVMIFMPYGFAGYIRGLTRLQPSYAVRFDVDYPERLSRGLIFVKWLLAIPHLIALYALGLVAGAITVAACFAILLTGRYPPGLFKLAVGINRWSANVSAYVMLMRDEYPPFSLEAAQYPVSYDVDYPQDLSRGLVLVKWLSAIPHLIVLALLWPAYLVTVVIAWFAILMTGRYPEGLFRFGVDVMRWAQRVSAYVNLLRDELPPFSLNNTTREDRKAGYLAPDG